MLVTPVIQRENFAADKAHHKSKNKIKTFCIIRLQSDQVYLLEPLTITKDFLDSFFVKKRHLYL